MMLQRCCDLADATYLKGYLRCQPLQPVAWGGVLGKGLEHAVAAL